MAPTPRKKKGKNYTLSELNRMLDLVEQMLPFGSEQWENLAACYNAHIPSGHAERDGDSLSRKFKKLYKLPKPSGNGTCPPHIERSKRLKRMIESSVAVATLHSDDDDAEDNSEDELDTADTNGSDDAMVAVEHAAEEGQPLRSHEETLNRTPPTAIDSTSFTNNLSPSTHDSPPSANNPQSFPNEMPLTSDNMPLTPTNTPPITNSASPTRQHIVL